MSDKLMVVTVIIKTNVSEEVLRAILCNSLSSCGTVLNAKITTVNTP